MIVGQFVKQPDETVSRSVDFAQDLETGEILVSPVTVTARHALTGSDTGNAILSGSASPSGAVVTQRFSGGILGDRHVIHVRAPTSLGNVVDGELLLAIDQI